MKESSTVYVGLDAYKDSIDIDSLLTYWGVPVRGYAHLRCAR